MGDITEIASFQALFTSQNNRGINAKATAHHHRHHMPLPHAPVDVSLRVVSFGTSKGVAHRLSSMGVIENSIIKVMHQAGNSLVIAVENTRLAIEPSIAHKVIVAPIAD